MARSRSAHLAVGILAVMVVAMVIAETASAAGVCNASALRPCMRAIQGARPAAPSRQCCDVVRRVDKVCMCNQFKTSSFPKQMLHNGLQLPNKCGRFDLRGFRGGSYTFPL